MHRRQILSTLLIVSVQGGAMLSACGASSGGNGSGSPDGPGSAGPSITRFAAADELVFVGDRTRLTAVFAGESAEIDGLGPVVSGTPVETPLLPASRTFTLTVRAAGRAVQATATVGVRYRDRIRQLPDAAVARTGHIAASLPDGSALVMGGNASESLNVPDSQTSDRFDPGSEAFARGPDLAFSAADPDFTTAVPLRNGFLLAGGGVNAGTPLLTPSPLLSQTFDFTGQQFRRAGDLRLRHAGLGKGTLLADGRVLMTGGGIPGIRRTEIYDPEARTWTESSPMGTGRRSHTTTLLHDGRVLVTGGLVCCTVDGQTVSEAFTASAELYDPGTDTFTPTGALEVARAFHQATLLPDGRVLISGGFGPPPPPETPDLRGYSEIYDPATGTFTLVGILQIPRGLHSAILLTDGRVLVLGGVPPDAPGAGAISLSEIFEPRDGSWSSGPMLQPAWRNMTATLLGTGKVLVFGGENAQGFPEPSTLLFE